MKEDDTLSNPVFKFRKIDKQEIRDFQKTNPYKDVRL